jgi:hypothetical protein
MPTITLPPDQPLVMAFDPGKANGWAMTCLPDLSWFEAGQGTIEEITDVFTAVIMSIGVISRMNSFMLIESFTVAGKPIGSSRTITVASESIGVLQHLARQYGITIVKRMPNDRTIVTIGHLRGRKWYPRGMDHAIQATRHLVSWLLTTHRIRLSIPDDV